ncbi:hypothetical protein ACHQM5_008272 [Ranunculus cassubicifolius]
MTPDTTRLDYWLNWRFLLCLIWVLISTFFASILIWRYEGTNAAKNEVGDRQDEPNWCLYADESWMPCLKRIHPCWLLAFRVFGFAMLLGLLITDIVVDGIGVLYYYTQWTFVSVTIYFGLGCLLSIYGCSQYTYKSCHDQAALDTERGTYLPLTYEENGKHVQPNGQHYARQIAGKWGYILQVLFQMNAGAVILTDCVFWFIIYPFLSANDATLTTMKIVTHSFNAVFLIADTALNCMQFPLFRIAYFTLWTATFVIFQWVVHAFISMPWPYPILELSSTYAPVWYLVVAMLHLPCYGFFYLLIKIKAYFLSKCSDYNI